MHTLLNIFFFSNSFSSGTDFSKKKRALSVVFDMVVVGSSVRHWVAENKKKSLRLRKVVGIPH